MKEDLIAFKNSKIGITIFVLSIFVALFSWFVHNTDVYHFALVGAIYEILWLPMITLLVFIPLFSLISLVKEKFHVKSLHYYSILIIITTILFMFFSN